MSGTPPPGSAPQRSPLFRAQSEPDLSVLPELYNVADVLERVTNANATSQYNPDLDHVSTPTVPTTPRASPVLRSSNTHSVSFSEYVASELARDAPPGVSFVPAAPAPPPTAAPALDVSDARFRARSETDDLSRFLADDDAVSEIVTGKVGNMDALESDKEDAQPPDASPMPPEPSSPIDAPFWGMGQRQVKLSCLEIDDQGVVTTRLLSRADILQEARETLHESHPSPVAAARWMHQLDDKHTTPEMRMFANFMNDAYQPQTNDDKQSRKALREYLRNYLRKYLRNSLQPRDIRQVDPAFAAKPALWIRHTALVVSMEGVRAIILRSKLFLFDAENEKTAHAADIARQLIMARPDLDNPQPFEFKALEGILIHVLGLLEKDFHQLKPQIERDLKELPDELTTKKLEDLRREKQRLNQFHSRATIVQDILEKVLEEDEDMANMYLTEKHTSPNRARNPVDHDEVEMLLEAYLQGVDELVNHATLLNDGIEDTEDLVMIHLDTLRNKLLSLELALSVVSMTFGFGGVIAGMFGMNLNIPLFESGASHFWFLGVCLLILAFVLSVSWLVLNMLKRRGLYSFH